MSRPGFHRVEDIFLVEDSVEDVPLHPDSRESFYNRIIVGVKALLKAQGITVTIFGAENIPTQGPALMACNHMGYYDFIFVGSSAYSRGRRLVRFMAKKELFDIPGARRLLARMKHIEVDRFAGRSALDRAVASLRDGNLVGIFPEGTTSPSFELQEFKTGAARIANRADCPLIPMALWGSQRIWAKDLPKRLGRNHFPVWLKVGEPVVRTGDIHEDTRRLEQAISNLLDEVRAAYEEFNGPFPGGENWRPASLGGGAPTSEEAAAKTRAIREKRRLKRAEKEAKKAAKRERRAARRHRREKRRELKFLVAKELSFFEKLKVIYFKWKDS
ncbi:1-acyl-sn-glycerol-3-phosphate acyltransferase [Corynebacterium sp. ES2794-CONJ1]|uniref:lysophospholipid acyltransferase family protein n=1 Tax=unclassified Corynebacterium TaxID=2624378 RepID=UPI0021676E92|nr:MULTISPECIES: lysophospholipid acyltransferase family protein [unclassified Corynebacterium]MCS4490124.1 1-acyl-sn-glycerol-3-phosphate acyltransferase [Corynebacterium sp. ES2775-CONJ]MCS4492067.1 1-acyl-sn-glycerol-3-phosphate acyltransferase [Corynebacterium sp. ES2715-CONJ3]MCS4532175.1 1-acyl-sn-glycerol-3-phosphate acyltransferase [Corynebacterium sp. ES2730-CONJ]MCU9519571.1 1-acyl-sn-glycerol-3-phosphate acyltransferase [Corynebacterium sp. ES2794-CONJ1]